MNKEQYQKLTQTIRESKASRQARARALWVVRKQKINSPKFKFSGIDFLS